jgi:hypothetical protein
MSTDDLAVSGGEARGKRGKEGGREGKQICMKKSIFPISNI